MSEVFINGFGKSGSELHLTPYIELGLDVVAYDKDPSKRLVVNLGSVAASAREAGRLQIIDDLSDLEQPDIIDITTASGNHIEALESTLASSNGAPKAVLIEKPVFSTADEKASLLSIIKDGTLDPNKTFVNENYNASIAIEKAKEIIELESTKGNSITNIDVVFYKNRVPDVRAGRFTDPVLGAFGIEMPHQIAVAYNLAGVGINEKIDIIESRYDTDVHGVEGSDATYVVAQTANGIILRMAQGLGPFTIDADGVMKEQQDVPNIRYTTITLNDGQRITINFDPVPGIERYHSQIILPNGTEHILKDDTLKRVIGGVVSFAENDKSPLIDGIDLRGAMKYVDDLTILSEKAKR